MSGAAGGSVGADGGEAVRGEAVRDITPDELMNFGKFILLLYGLKWFRHGMETGNLPKLVTKIGKFLAREIIRNPDFLLYVGTGYLGSDVAAKAGGNLKDMFLGGMSGMMAFRVAVSGNPIAGTAAAAYLATLGFGWLWLNLPDEVKQKVLPPALGGELPILPWNVPLVP